MSNKNTSRKYSHDHSHQQAVCMACTEDEIRFAAEAPLLERVNTLERTAQAHAHNLTVSTKRAELAETELSRAQEHLHREVEGFEKYRQERDAFWRQALARVEVERDEAKALLDTSSKERDALRAESADSQNKLVLYHEFLKTPLGQLTRERDDAQKNLVGAVAERDRLRAAYKCKCGMNKVPVCPRGPHE